MITLRGREKPSGRKEAFAMTTKYIMTGSYKGTDLFDYREFDSFDDALFFSENHANEYNDDFYIEEITQEA